MVPNVDITVIAVLCGTMTVVVSVIFYLDYTKFQTPLVI